MTRIAGAIVILCFAANLALLIPSVQTGLSERILDRIGKNLGGDVTIGGLHVAPFNAVKIENLTVRDRNPYTEDKYNRGWAPVDTILHVDKMTATLSLGGLFKGKGVHAGRLVLEGATLHLATEPDGEYPSNIARFFNSHSHPAQEKKADPENIFDAGKITVRDFRFRLSAFKNKRRIYKGIGMNWQDLDVHADLIKGHSFKIGGGYFSGVADKIVNLSEKSGYLAYLVKGRARVGHGLTLIEDIRILDKWSDLKGSSYSMSYDEGDASFKHYETLVRMGLEFRKSHLSFISLRYFTDALANVDFTMDIESGHIEGPMKDLKITDLKFNSEEFGIGGSLSGEVKGLSQIPNELDATLKDFHYILNGRRIDFNGRVYGPTDNLSGHIEAASGKGTAAVSLHAAGLTGKDPIRLNGTLEADEINVSEFIRKGFPLDRISASTGFDAAIGRGSRKVAIDSMIVSKASLRGYEYSGIKINALLSGDLLDADIRSTDPNAIFSLEGSGNISRNTDSEGFKLKADIERFNLTKTNLFKPKSGDAVLSLGADADFKRLPSAGIPGEILLSDIYYEDEKAVHPVGDIRIISGVSDTTHSFSLASSFLDAEYLGSSPINTFISALKGGKILSGNIPRPLSVSMDFHDSRDLFAAIFPGIYISDGTSAFVRVDRNGGIDGNIRSGRLAKGSSYLKDVNMDLGREGDSLKIVMSSAEVSVKGINLTEGNLSLNGWRDGNAIMVGIDPDGSSFAAGDNRWSFDPSTIRIDGRDFGVDALALRSGEQAIYLDGALSSSNVDTLSLSLRNLDLAIANVLSSKDMGLGGTLSGNAELISPFGKERTAVNMSIRCDSLIALDRYQGAVGLSSTWDEEKEMLMFMLKQEDTGFDALSFSGKLHPSDRKIDFRADMNELNLSILQPFLKGVFSEMGGTVSGTFVVDGTMEAPVIRSDNAKFSKALLRLAATNVPYCVDGPFRFNEKVAEFKGISITDGGNGSAELNGTITYDRFREALLDFSLSLNGIKMLDIPSGRGKSISGSLSGSGNAKLNGSFDALSVTADITTSGPGLIDAALGRGMEATTSNLLTFVRKDTVGIDPYEEMMTSLYGKESTASGNKVSLLANIRVLPDIETRLDIDPTSGSGLSARGDGLIRINIKPSGQPMDLSGRYDISSGNFKFSIPNIVAKDFDIREGSSIRFGGDLMDSNLDIDAVYRTRASLSTLIQADSSSANTRRVVECGINITDKLSNPDLNLSINIEDLDPATKSKVDAALSTEDKLQKQFVSLLILGTFMPDDPSGIVNGGNMLLSNVGEILSSQFSNILQRLDIPMDLGFKYQQNASSGRDIFDVAISTQLFNNRVLVNGNLGNRFYGTTSSPNGGLVGDINIEIKLDNPGQLRLSLFSRSADEFTSYLDLSQRSGVGLSFQKEYTSFKELLRSFFSSKQQRERMAIRKAQEEEELTLIKIEKDE